MKDSCRISLKDESTIFPFTFLISSIKTKGDTNKKYVNIILFAAKRLQVYVKHGYNLRG